MMGSMREVWLFSRLNWRPPDFFGEGVVGLRDYIIGFALFGVGGYIHSLIHQKTDQL